MNISKSRLLVAVPIWSIAFVLRIVLILVGFVAVPLAGPRHPIWGNNEDPKAPSWFMEGDADWWRNYVWRAWRNPTNNVRFWLEEPEIWTTFGEDNPEYLVRNGHMKRASRLSISGIFFEYWIMWRRSGNKFAEFRIGWKRSPVPGFGLTAQLGFDR